MNYDGVIKLMEDFEFLFTETKLEQVTAQRGICKLMYIYTKATNVIKCNKALITSHCLKFLD